MFGSENGPTITVDKARLLDTLLTNKEEHRATFEAAQVVYREKVIEALERRLAEARSGDPLRTTIRLPEPVDYTDQFVRIIQMLNWHADDTVELTPDEFDRYVRNRWEWQRTFEASTQAYVTGAVHDE